jgi:hypothetical protein
MARYKPFLKPEYDRDFFLDLSRWSFGNTYEDAVARALHRLLYTGKQSQEDKIEVKHKLFSSLQPIVSYIRMTSFLYYGIMCAWRIFKLTNLRFCMYLSVL